MADIEAKLKNLVVQVIQDVIDYSIFSAMPHCSDSGFLLLLLVVFFKIQIQVLFISTSNQVP